MLPCHLSWEGGGKSLPPIFRCDIIFLVEISVVIDPNYFQIKSEKHPFYLLQFLFFYFRHFVLPLYTCHLFIYMNSVNINLHKIMQNNWKINDHSSFVGRRWQVTSPNFSLWHNFPCRNFRCHRPQLFSNKSEKHPFPSTFYNFCSFIFVISSCHSTHAIFLYTVNINLHKIKQNNWKINHHSTPLRICHNASDQVLTYGYFKSVCIDFRSLITTSTRTLASDLDALWYAYSHVHLMHIW